MNHVSISTNTKNFFLYWVLAGQATFSSVAHYCLKDFAIQGIEECKARWLGSKIAKKPSLPKLSLKGFSFKNDRISNQPPPLFYDTVNQVFFGYNRAYKISLSI